MSVSNPMEFLEQLSAKYFSTSPIYEEEHVKDSVGVTDAYHEKKFFYVAYLSGFKARGKGMTKYVAKKKACLSLIEILFEKSKRLNECSENLNAPKCLNCMETEHKNPTSILYEFCENHKKETPLYRCLLNTKSTKVFECIVEGKRTFGVAETKKEAKKNSSMKMLQQLNIDKHVLCAGENCGCNSSLKNPIAAILEIGQMIGVEPTFLPGPSTGDSSYSVKCCFGDKSSEGTASTIQDAKALAAAKVLAILQAEEGMSDCMTRIGSK